MKKLLFVVLIGVLVIGGQLSAKGTEEDPITGTWYGGSKYPDAQGHKYIYQFSPLGPGHWQLLCLPASSPAAYGGFLTMTPFAGEIRKTASGYELRLMCVATSAVAAAPPNELPVVVAGRAVLTVMGPDRIDLLYDTAGVYAWGKMPFVDSPAAWAYRPGNGGPVPETIYRLKTTVEINLKRFVGAGTCPCPCPAQPPPRGTGGR